MPATQKQFARKPQTVPPPPAKSDTSKPPLSIIFQTLRRSSRPTMSDDPEFEYLIIDSTVVRTH